MKTLRYPMVALIAVMVWLLACSSTDSFIWSIGGPQVALDAMGTDISPISTKASPPSGSSVGSCVAPADSYAWSYENFKTSSGTGGVMCNARFTMRNAGGEPLYVLVFTAWDNNAMQDSRWKKSQLQPGGQWEENVSRTIYTDGVVTYSRVERVLVIRDAPECADLLSAESQPTWEARAVQVNPLSCP